MRQILFISAISLLFLGCTQSKNSTEAIAPKVAMGQLVNRFAILVDLRTDHSRSKEGATHLAQSLPLPEIEKDLNIWKDFLDKTDKNKSIILMKDPDQQIKKIIETAHQKGFDVKIVGSFQDWKKAKLPVQSNTTEETHNQ